MVNKIRISGVKRRTVAVESTSRYFQTNNLIISHLKREADKKMIMDLIQKDPTVKSLLIGTAAIHLYNYMGIRVKNQLEANKFSDQSTLENEQNQKYILLEEIELALKESFNLEINLLDKVIDIENLFISLLIQERDTNYQDAQKLKDLSNIEQKIEQELLNIILKYPSFYFYDFIGDLIGFTDEIKLEILEESSAFKDLSVDIETKLEREEKEDKFLELSTLDRLITKIQSDFEFKSYKELQTQTMSLRMIKKRIVDHELNKYPISIYGLKAYLEGNNYKKMILSLIEKAFSEKESFDTFEAKILNNLKQELISKFKSHPNDLIYFLQSLNDSSFDDIIFLINKRGVNDIIHLLKIDEHLLDNVRKNLIRYNIKKQDLVLLNDFKKNPIFLAKKVLCNFKKPYLDIVQNTENLGETDLFRLLHRNEPKFQEIWQILEKELNLSINDLRELVRKKQIIDKIFFHDFNLKNYLQLITLIDFDQFLNKVTLDIFYYILSRIIRQLSRIIEVYAKISNDKTLFLSALRVVDGKDDKDTWGWIKLEELCIDRLIKRQDELVIVLNANNQVFLVNGFILSRLTDNTLKGSIESLRNDTSYIYKDVSPLRLKADLISPVSYCIAYDLLKRFESYNEEEVQKVKLIEHTQKNIDEKRKLELREKQEENTLNWIERKITSASMGINRPGINPNQFYWQEKDTKTATEFIKIHSELEGGTFKRLCEFYEFCIEKIRTFVPDMILPDVSVIEKEISEISTSVLRDRLGASLTEEDFNKAIDGERYEIGKQIIKKIGKLLNNALYYKFKNPRRNISN